jgi:uncharacterized membrane-anchored protein
MKIALSNKMVLIACHKMSVKKLTHKDREFVNSVMRQIIDHPEGFKLSQKQFEWLQDIWHRYGLAIWRDA